MLEFNFKNKTKKHIIERKIRLIAKKFYKIFFAKENIQISTSVVNLVEIIRLNQKLFGKHEPTDIISIESKLKITPISLGEIIICADIAEKQGKEIGHSFQKEIEILFVHGLIHLLGYEHESKNQKKVWQKLINKINEAK